MKIFIVLFLTILNGSFAAAISQVSIATTSYKPFVSLDENGNASGIYHEYLQTLSKKIGMEPKIEVLPLSRVLKHATKGTHDFLMVTTDAPEVDNKYIEVARFNRFQIILISNQKKIDFNSPTLIIGRPIGSPCPVFNSEQEKKVTFFDYSSTHDALRMLKHQRLNAVCTNRSIFYHEMQKSPYASMKTYEFPEFHHEFTHSLFVNRRLPPKKIAMITKAVSDLEQKQVLPSLYRKYGLD